ncbi:hypothetical protein C9374_007660 [Naegleria lovaniensis]|uniref:Uncharacterized protein n=1 Tax=Naegleria lovaniensis TaxID=51637 RepID=A0AA88GKF5_NAELO|nr:uncharacterized protein C9374_007660 [Naegleria lovaniensis]KAG2379022.1 hypothetical protein C9374_007660 [Naegleria lovaniensis]
MQRNMAEQNLTIQPSPSGEETNEPSSSTPTREHENIFGTSNTYHHIETNTSPSTIALSSSPLLSLQSHHQPYHSERHEEEEEILGSSPLIIPQTIIPLSLVVAVIVVVTIHYYQRLHPLFHSATLKQIQRRKELENWRKNRRTKSIITNRDGSSTSTHMTATTTSKGNNNLPTKSSVPLRKSYASGGPLTSHLETASNKKRKFSESTQTIANKKVTNHRLPNPSNSQNIMRQQQETSPIIQQSSIAKRNDNIISFSNLLKIDKYLPGSNTVHHRVKQADEKENTDLNLSSILIVDDKENVEEDRHMLDNIAKIADSIEEEDIPPSVSLASSTGLSSASATLNQTSSVLLDVSCLDKSEPRSARKSLKQKSFLSSGNGSSFFSTSTGFSPLPSFVPSKTPLFTLKSTSLKPLKNPNLNSGEEDATKLNYDLACKDSLTNNSTSQLRDNSNTSKEEIEFLKAKILDLEERLRKESLEKDLWKENYKNLLSSRGDGNSRPVSMEANRLLGDTNTASKQQLE